ncbi:MAG: pilus assembly protein [Acidobacteria bacterium]|nr:pilus assembly protein [Acidobacteriota bacterium]
MRGQATVETVVVMTFLLFMIFGLIHVCLLAVTKYMVSLAAFSAGRALMVHGTGWVGQAAAWTAATTVLDNLRWWKSAWQRLVLPPTQGRLDGREGVFVTHRAPFAFPIFNDLPFGGLPVTAFSAVAIQPDIPEKGDNAE